MGVLEVESELVMDREREKQEGEEPTIEPTEGGALAEGPGRTWGMIDGGGAGKNGGQQTRGPR